MSKTTTTPPPTTLPYTITGNRQINPSSNSLPVSFLVAMDIKAARDLCEKYIHHENPPNEKEEIHGILWRILYHIENADARYQYMKDNGNRKFDDL